MKRIFTLFVSVFSIVSNLNAQSSYSGNGGASFGGGVGNSTLTVSDDVTNINFSLATTGFTGNVLVIYLDTKTGGISSTSSLTDQGDGGRIAVSGLGSSTRTLASFPSGFTADYAIAIDPDASTPSSSVYNLSTPGSFGFVSSANLSGSGTGTLTFSVSKANVGLGAAASFRFVGTLISTTAYRSNETLGTSTTIPGSAGDAPSAGFTGTTTFSASNLYTLVLPLKLISFSGKTDNGIVWLNWVTSNESGVQNFVIEGSTNSINWNSLATVAAKNTATAQYVQTLTDATNNFYRLKMVDKDGKLSYSPIINLKSTGYNVKLINNPVIGNIRLSINADADKYVATVYSLEGRAIASKTYGHPGGVSTLEIPLANVAKGNYVLRVANGSASKSFNVVVQ